MEKLEELLTEARNPATENLDQLSTLELLKTMHAADREVFTAVESELPNITKAKKKPLDVLKPEDLGVDVSPRLRTLRVTEPPKRSAGVKVADVQALLEKLRNEAKML